MIVLTRYGRKSESRITSSTRNTRGMGYVLMAIKSLENPLFQEFYLIVAGNVAGFDQHDRRHGNRRFRG